VRYRRKYKADDGNDGGGSRKTGKNGKDIIVLVPVGTVVRNKKENTFIADLIENGETIIMRKGGMGGKGNIRFKTSTNQAPRIAQSGLPGETGHFIIELKVLADVGLVGLPNAGKSTLLSRISSARPKIADYPFTTLNPNLGIVKYGDYNSFVMADIPGLIEGASKGKGLGHQFLKHIERNKVLLYLIDCTDETPYQTFKTLENEILQFNADLDVKPKLICRTKADLESELSEEWGKFEQEILVISSISGEGLNRLIATLVKMI
jgi:GTP-binding protein